MMSGRSRHNVSVIIPAYNRAGLIGATLTSIMGQSAVPSEVVVIDDGSTDQTCDEVEQIGLPVRLIRQANRGPGAARNAGFSITHGDYVQFMDSDDIALSNKLEVQARALADSGADIAYGPWLKAAIDDHQLHPENLVFQQGGLPSPSRSLYEWLLTDWSIIPHACLFRRSFVDRVGGFPEDLYGVEDQEFFRRCLLAEAKVVHTPQTLTVYRVGEHEKITSETNPRAGRHSLDWLRFLLTASDDRRSQPDPTGWFAYRCRLWRAAQVAAADGTEDARRLRKSAMEKLKGHGSQLLYRVAIRLGRWRGGLQVRLTGGRAHSCFRMGRVTLSQRTMLAQNGYSLADSR
jgi:glycosyltransferase involved in cell wall biosynthesis